MSTPLVLILVYLSSTFLLGLVLGWLLWQFGRSAQVASIATEVSYWKERLEQSRAENGLNNDRIVALEKERDILKQRLRSNISDKSA